MLQHVIARDGMIPPSQFGGLMTETGLTLKTLLWTWHIIYPTSHHYEHPLYRRNKTNSSLDVVVLCTFVD